MTSAPIQQFFATFSAASDSLDLEVLGRCFADPFLSADASGSQPVPRAAFLQALPRRAKIFADAGLGAAVLESVTESRLDEHYVLARTEWTVPRLAGGDPVRLASSFLLHEVDGEQLIVLYLNHQGLPS
jgi:hypothetical protein